MIIHQFIKRGTYHKDYCEDFAIIVEKQDYKLFGVFDGCSSGVESHFASAFIAKIIRAEFQKLDKEIQNQPLFVINKLLYNSILSLKKQKKELILQTNELLSTFLLFLYNSVADEGIIVVAGDGVVSINGKSVIIDENNAPNYVAYHIDKINTNEDYKHWFAEHTRNFTVKGLKDVSISTDGILSFIHPQLRDKQQEDIDPLNYLLKNDFLLNNKSMLGRKCHILEGKHSLINFDDLGIIRIVMQ